MKGGEVLAYSSDDGKFTALTNLSPKDAERRKVDNPRRAKRT